MATQCVGEIRIFAGNYAPQGWLICDGTKVGIAQYQVLFSLIGTTYGGDGVNNFALPDLRGRLPISQGVSPYGTTFALGAAGGTETTTLTAAQIPAHTHPPKATAASATSGNPSGMLMAQTVNSSGGTNQDIMYLKQNAPYLQNDALNAAAVTNTGNSQPHNNVMPCVAINFIIATTGEYPDFS
jgi:microcystin-dependent protein